jgi:hypothetical protein
MPFDRFGAIDSPGTSADGASALGSKSWLGPFAALPACCVSNNTRSENQVYAHYPVYKMEIVIVGAGLGGLAAALAVKSANPPHKVLVIESAPQLAEVGANLNCSGYNVVFSSYAKLTCGYLTR